MTIITALVFYFVLFFVVYLAASLLWHRKVGENVRTPIVIRAQEKGKMGVMDKVLVIECIAIVLYVIADFIVFWHTGNEPYTLTVSFFAVCGGENGFMAWIKTRKEQERMRQWQMEDLGKPEAYKEDKDL